MPPMSGMPCARWAWSSMTGSMEITCACACNAFNPAGVTSATNPAMLSKRCPAFTSPEGRASRTSCCLCLMAGRAAAMESDEAKLACLRDVGGARQTMTWTVELVKLCLMSSASVSLSLAMPAAAAGKTGAAASRPARSGSRQHSAKMLGREDILSGIEPRESSTLCRFFQAD